MGTRIVEARPEHVPFIAWVILAASRSHLERGFFDFLVGGQEPDVVRYLEILTTTEQLHFAHFSTFIVAEVNGRPASALCGFFDEEHGGSRLLQGMAEADRTLGRPENENAAGRAQADTIRHVRLAEHPPNTWIMECVATLPKFRRRGLIDRLMEEILERGRRRGATVADVRLFIGNDPAQRAYEKAGFRPIEEKRHPDFEAVYKCPGMRLLRRALGGTTPE